MAECSGKCTWGTAMGAQPEANSPAAGVRFLCLLRLNEYCTRHQLKFFNFREEEGRVRDGGRERPRRRWRRGRKRRGRILATLCGLLLHMDRWDWSLAFLF